MPKKLSRPFVLTVAMPKGGVGKTTTTVNVARGLDSMGWRVLVLDLDERADATRHLGVDVGPDTPTMFEVLAARSERVDLDEAIIATPFGVDVVPSTAAMRQYGTVGLGPNGDLKIRRLVQQLSSERYDLVLIDTPPNRGPLLTAGLFAADSVLAVVTVGKSEINALQQLDGDMLELQDASDEAASIDFVVLTSYRSGSNVAKSMRLALRKDWDAEYLGEISHSVRVSEASLADTPVIDYDPKSYPAQDYLRISQAIAERLEAK